MLVSDDGAKQSIPNDLLFLCGVVCVPFISMCACMFVSECVCVHVCALACVCLCVCAHMCAY